MDLEEKVKFLSRTLLAITKYNQIDPDTVDKLEEMSK